MTRGNGIPEPTQTAPEGLQDDDAGGENLAYLVDRLGTRFKVAVIHAGSTGEARLRSPPCAHELRKSGVPVRGKPPGHFLSWQSLTVRLIEAMPDVYADLNYVARRQLVLGQQQRLHGAREEA